ncbi:Oxoglutarate/iron-dependent dioxygenase [Sesbania bispinosa]|nr:Oxoglutarate/iron-dependent dioxygenase [Sesbania bispinosa]
MVPVIDLGGELGYDNLSLTQQIIKASQEFEYSFRDVMGSYSVKVRKLSLQLLDLICKGLGLDSGYFSDELSNVQLIAINHYPTCPDPSLTLGLPKHSYVNLITLLFQDDEMHGLQVWKDGQWFAVEPLPNALVVNIGHMLQVHLPTQSSSFQTPIPILSLRLFPTKTGLLNFRRKMV